MGEEVPTDATHLGEGIRAPIPIDEQVDHCQAHWVPKGGQDCGPAHSISVACCFHICNLTGFSMYVNIY